MSDITLLDGSIGQELVKRAKGQPTPMWSTSVMLDQPETVEAVHKAYFDAGAMIATANTYAVHRDRLPMGGLEDRFEDLIDMALQGACAARDANGGGRVAGAMGPLGATYRTDKTPPAAEAAPLFAELVDLMRDRVDLFILETVASVDQARGGLMGCQKAERPVWLSVTVDDEDGTRLRSGEAVADLATVVAEFAPDAVLINCSRPEAIPAGLGILKTFGRPFGAYANGFTKISEGFLKDAPTVDALEERKDLGPEAYANLVMGWIDQGATIVGGCCEVGPDHIAELARRLKADGHHIV